MRLISAVLVLVGAFQLASDAAACDSKTGERQQLVFASWAGESLAAMYLEGDEMMYFQIPNGVKFGVRTRPVSDDVYREQFQWRKYNSELVHLEFYDTKEKQPTLIAETLAGANSTSNISADFVPGVGDPRLRVELQKSVCVSADDLSRKGPAQAAN
jgi:hypothetical protein